MKLEEPVVAHRSFSQITSWLRCGMAYRLERVDKVVQTPAWWFVGGKAVHSATEYLDTGAATTVGEAWDQAWAEAIAETEHHTITPQDEWRAGGRITKDKPNRENGVWWQGAGLNMVGQWLNWRRTYPNWALAVLPEPHDGPAVEPEFNVWFGEVPVKGFIDRVFDVTGPGGQVNRCVVDIKTGSSMPDDALQLGLYACMIELAYGPAARPEVGCYYDARKGDITVPVDLSGYGIELLTDMFTMFSKAVANEVYIPHLGRHCRTCSVSASCVARNPELATLNRS